MSDETQNLDGKTPVKVVPFDAHERATRGEHVPTQLDSPGPDLSNIQEVPKAVDHVDHPSGVGKQPVIVNSAEEEAEYHDAKAEAEPEPAKLEKADGKKAPRLTDFED
jgi:hypothetical protein